MAASLHVTSPLMSGPAVLDVQKRLTALGYAPGAVDGRYGPATAAAVKDFQRDRKLEVDGIAGPLTLAALRQKPAKAPAAAPEPATTPVRRTQSRSSPGERALAEAITHIGVKEKPSGSNRNPFGEWFGVNGVPWCFPPGTLIRMADGSHKPIEDVRTTELVASAEGRARHVRGTSARFHAGEIVRVRLWGHQHLRLTEEHPVLTERGYVPAGELRRNDFVSLPRYLPCPERAVESSRLIARKRRSCASCGCDFAAYTSRCRTCYARHRRRVSAGSSVLTLGRAELPDRLVLTAGLGRLLGLYAAEGSVREKPRGRTSFALSAAEGELAQEIVELIETELAHQARIEDRSTIDNSVNVTVNGIELARLFEALVGTGSAAKRLHSSLFAAPEEFLRALLFGWLEGDGHRQQRQRVGVTISKALAHDMLSIASALGLRPTIDSHKPKSRDNSRRREAWIVKFPDPENPGSPAPGVAPRGHDTWRCRQTEESDWRKVRVIERQPYAGFVYNLSVDSDASYIAEGVAVHNCNVFVSYCFQVGAGYTICKGFKGAGAYPGKGSTYVPTTEAWLQAAGFWVGRSEPRPGDIAIFNWDGGVPDHIGIVEEYLGDGQFHAIEGNTSAGNDSNGGEVMRRLRTVAQVDGFGRVTAS